MVLRETFWTEEQPTISPQERELQKAERWAEVEGGGKRQRAKKQESTTPQEREMLKIELRAEAVWRKFSVATAFYWLSGRKPNMTIKEAVEIVDEVRALDGRAYPFVD